MNAIFQRTSVRQFEQTAVEPEKIEKMLRAAMQAPTAGNQQPWELYVVTDKDKLAQLSEVTPYAACAKGAPLAIVIAYREDGIFPDFCQIDCAIATENIWLEASELGLGGVMLGIAPVEDRMEAVENILNMPEGVRAFTIIPIGYPKKISEQKDRFDETRIHWVK